MTSKPRRQPEPHALRVYLITETRRTWRRTRVVDCKMTRSEAATARDALAAKLGLPKSQFRIVAAIAAPDLKPNGEPDGRLQ
jgi:hypothetical protein